MKNNTILRVGEPKDFLYIDSLRKIEGNALGFVPAESLISILEKRPQWSGGINRRYIYSGIIITEDNNQKTGYCYYAMSGDIANIFQIVVQEDARRFNRALLMIDYVEKKAINKQKQGIKARVAFDLESNWFWQACGYSICDKTTSTWMNQRESKSKRPINVYFKPLTPLFNMDQQEQINATFTR